MMINTHTHVGQGKIMARERERERPKEREIERVEAVWNASETLPLTTENNNELEKAFRTHVST